MIGDRLARTLARASRTGVGEVPLASLGGHPPGIGPVSPHRFSTHTRQARRRADEAGLRRRGEAPPGCHLARVAVDGSISPAGYERVRLP